MILKNASYDKLSENIHRFQKKIIVYGAGMIGQVIVPYLAKEYKLCEYVEVFVDSDNRKKGKKIQIGNRPCEITTPEYLYKINSDYIILITNSKFYSIIQFLDGIKNLENIEGYIIPIMQMNELNCLEDISFFNNSREQLIPKKIHYCWFGENRPSPLLQKCIDSWKEYCPDYEIIEWNEKNYDVNKHIFTKEAYGNHKYGFVSDLARFDILYEQGGVYLDTDVMLIKSMDMLLHEEGFIGVEKWGNINSGGGCGFIPKHPIVKEIIEYRDEYPFILEDGSLNTETNGIYETKIFLDKGFKPNNKYQIIGNVSIYPSFVMHPYDYVSEILNERESTISIHLFNGGWLEKKEKKERSKTQQIYLNIIERICNGGKPQKQ